MTKNRLAFLSVLSLCLLMVGPTAPAVGKGSRGPGAESTEVLSGYYHCGMAFGDTASTWIDLNGTGDLIPNYFPMYTQYEGDTSTAAACEAPTAAFVELLEGVGCSVSSVNVEPYTDPDGISLNFRFICHGKRSQVIAIIGELAEQMYTD